MSRTDERLHRWEALNDVAVPSRGWTIRGYPGSRTSSAAVVVSDYDPAPGESRQVGWPASEAKIPASLRTPFHFAFREAPALAKYVAATDQARPGLTDPSRLAALVDALRASPMFHRYPPGDHWSGDKMNVDLAIHRVLGRSDPRYFDGRPIHGEHHPPDDELVPLIRAQIAPGVTERVSDAQISEQLERFRDVRPWPFDVLVG
ncbi:MAG TPA: hypothetical protein VHC63_18860 [Acidimicrobiales bacterium]|nr:hypothetical protein [Acidimicrobiales bacterium]